MGMSRFVPVCDGMGVTVTIVAGVFWALDDSLGRLLWAADRRSNQLTLGVETRHYVTGQSRSLETDDGGQAQTGTSKAKDGSDGKSTVIRYYYFIVRVTLVSSHETAIMYPCTYQTTPSKNACRHSLHAPHS